MKTIRYNFLIAALISASLTSVASAGQTFTLKGESPTGTKLQSVDAHASLPFDKRYFELTEAQRSTYRARFDSISADQIPPFPRNGLRDVYRPLIDANEKGLSGYLQVDVQVNAQGEVEDLTVLESPSNQLALASEKILRNTKFDPGYCAGEPCKMTFPVQIKYR